MKNLSLIIIICSAFIFNCNTSKTSIAQKNERLQNIKENDTVKISSDKVEYEIIIIEPGFNTWLVSTARPEGFYSQQYMETRNYQYVVEWNQRVNQPFRYNTNLYELQIDYQPNIDYGYEVNYKLYNYFIYFQLKYNQRLGSFTPRI
ncbi:DUF6146 family protein [Neotamlana laminarinivorans]|uniref:DUF6146 family protein n=1 Tax=Neotamlana laminarinivorans TaxID=2883124 RepID=A0A9X1L2N7_9FLAO|nr:DUF6146 family protein [Tamlana laminarinivorans]MCB4799963.1 DUF6146 family protein [Tamlana laminarinivorans]